VRAVTELPLTAIRQAIAEAMYPFSASEIGDICDGMGMPPTDYDPMSSKKMYVRKRLAALQEAELIEMARKVAREVGDNELLRLIEPPGFLGVDGELKNLIFAAHGPKMRIVLRDAISNRIEIVNGADHCLVYDRPLGADGLTWGALVQWWTETHSKSAVNLFQRLSATIGSPAEQTLWGVYCKRYRSADALQTPALIPQVYLHYDPYTLRELTRAGEGQALARQRMDFLLLLPDRSRIVIEVDGKQHYAEGNTASPRLYAATMAEDRRLRLAGYEIYRFGGYDLMPDDPAAPRRVDEFFDELFARHQIT
jgi:very-short-patch-repair endonuclease